MLLDMRQEMILLIVFKYITEIEEFDLENRIVIPCLNEEGYRTLLIKNSKDKTLQTTFTTKHLLIKKNMVLESNRKEYYVHIITCREKSDYMDNNFNIIFEYLFDKLVVPISDDEFSELITSIQELFKQNTENLNSVQVGTTGELMTLLYLYRGGMKDIFNKYHKSQFSKHDIELDGINKIEVKSTTKDYRIHRFSHDQLNNKLLNIFISSVKVEVVENGLSLYELFIKVLAKISDPEVKFQYRKLMNYCGIDIFNQGIKFNYDESLSNVKLMNSKEVPQLKGDFPEGIANIVYDSICDMAPEIMLPDFINMVEK